LFNNNKEEILTILAENDEKIKKIDDCTFEISELFTPMDNMLSLTLFVKFTSSNNNNKPAIRFLLS